MGLKTRLAQDWEAGVFVGMGLNRDSSDADRLKGLDDIDYHATYGAFVEWRPGPYALGLAYRHAAHKGYGGVMELRASYGGATTAMRCAWASTPNGPTATPCRPVRRHAGPPPATAPVCTPIPRLRASSRRRCMPPVASVVRALEHGRHAGRIDGAGRRPRQPVGRARQQCVRQRGHGLRVLSGSDEALAGHGNVRRGRGARQLQRRPPR